MQVWLLGACHAPKANVSAGLCDTDATCCHTRISQGTSIIIARQPGTAGIACMPSRMMLIRLFGMVRRCPPPDQPQAYLLAQLSNLQTQTHQRNHIQNQLIMNWMIIHRDCINRSQPRQPHTTVSLLSAETDQASGRAQPQWTAWTMTETTRGSKCLSI